MKWSDIGELVGKYAPMVGTLVGGPAGTVLGSVIASTLGVENTPEAVQGFLQEHPEKADPLLKQMQEKNKSQYELMLLELQKVSIQEQAATQRAELASTDKFKSYWRPCFGYIMALSFLILNIAFSIILFKIVDNPTSMAATVTAISQLMGPMSIIWGMGLTILGINVHSRSKDKLTEVGATSGGGILSKLSGFMSKSN